MANLDNIQELPKKEAPKPSKPAIDKAKYFELQLIDVAIKAFKNKEYLKSAMMSWSFIEEFFLPTAIDFIAKKQKIKVDGILAKPKGIYLINLYYFISLDGEVYSKLCEANSLRNKLVHESYKSGSFKDISVNARKSADCNLEAFSIIGQRVTGKVIYPSLTLYSRGWNDYRKEALQALSNMK